MAIQRPVNFSPAPTTTHSHNRQISVASFSSSLYLPVDPDNHPRLDDDDTYPSSDELFGPDHEEGDDYTISSRRHLSYSRHSAAFSHPPTPPRSTRSTMSLERSSSSLSLASPPRHGNTEPGSNYSPSAWTNRPAVIRTMATTSTTELPSPPSTARSSNEAPMSTSLATDQGVPIEKFDQLVLEHLEIDYTLLAMLQKLAQQKVRISQLTYALSRLRVMSNSTCLLPPYSSVLIPGPVPVPQPRRLGAVIPKPLVVQQSSKSATASTITGAGLSGPSQNEAVNQRRRAKQQLHEFALRRRPTRAAPKSRSGGKPAVETVKRRGWEWEGARGSSSMVVRETKPRTATLADAVGVGHPNITIRRPKRSEPPAQLAKNPVRPPRPTVTTSEIPTTPPRLASLFASPNRTPTQSRLSVHGSPSTQSRLSVAFDTPVPPRKLKDKPLPLLPPGRPRNVSYTYEIPPVPSPDHITAHVTMVDPSRRTPTLPAEEVQHRLAATFAHFSHPAQSEPSPPRRGLDVRPEELLGPMDRRESDHLQEMLRQKWVTQLDEHSHQARGSWRSPLRSFRQKLAGGFGVGRKSSRASVSMSSSEDHSTSLDTPGYVHGLDTLQEGEDGLDLRGKKSKKKAGKDKDEVPSTPKATKSTWRFSRLASASS